MKIALIGATAAIVEQSRLSVRDLTAQREEAARRIATKLGISVPAASAGNDFAGVSTFGVNRGRIGAPAGSRASKQLITGSVKASATTATATKATQTRITQMTTFPVNTIESAPEGSKPAMQQLQSAFGMIPNLIGAMSTSPVLINSLVGLFGKVHGSSFTEAQVQIVLLTDAVTNASSWAVAFHSALALKEGIDPADVQAIREGRLPKDSKFAALSTLAKAMIEKRGRLNDQDVDRFLAAGFGKDHLLEVIAAVAASTITNYTGSITKPPLDAPFQAQAWAN